MPTSQWPNDEDARRLHAALSHVSATATEEFAVAFLRPLAGYLLTRQPVLPDLCEEAAARAIMSLIRAPQLYNPDRGLSVGAFLRMAARGDLANLLKSERRHWRQRRDVSLESVEHATGAGNNEQVADGPTWDDPRLKSEIAAFGPAEQTTFRLLCEEVRDTAAFGAALGLKETGSALVAAVKRHKDLVKARLKRAVGGSQ